MNDNKRLRPATKATLPGKPKAKGKSNSILDTSATGDIKDEAAVQPAAKAELGGKMKGEKADVEGTGEKASNIQTEGKPVVDAKTAPAKKKKTIKQKRRERRERREALKLDTRESEIASETPDPTPPQAFVVVEHQLISYQ